MTITKLPNAVGYALAAVLTLCTLAVVVMAIVGGFP